MALTDLAMQCACGTVQWAVRDAARSWRHLVCYCDDCQAFARHLGCADRILDPHGGTEAVQTSPARIAIDAGSDRLACLRLRPRGLLRWYATCCRTPIANTLAARQLPFAALIQPFCVADSDRRARDAALGPVQGRVHGRFALADGDRLDAHDRMPAPLLLELVAHTLAARLRGDHARSPFFTACGDPIAPPRVLSADELAACQPPTARG